MAEEESGRFVLPRFLRRPARVAERLAKLEWTPPRFANAILTTLLIGSSVAYGTVVGGHGPLVVKTVTSRSGFAVDQVRVTGNRETSEIDILDRLELDGWTSLVGFSAAEARNRIAALPWVQDVTVRKIYPRTLEVKVEEREAFAIWQQGQTLTVVKRDGSPITQYSGGGGERLPLIVGAGAPEHAADFVPKVAAYPGLAERVRGYVRVGDRRWDLVLISGVTVKLPERDEDAALQEIAQLDAQSGVLERDIAAVDLRLADRVVVQLTETAVKAREALLKAEEQAARKRKREARI